MYDLLLINIKIFTTLISKQGREKVEGRGGCRVFMTSIEENENLVDYTIFYLSIFMLILG